MHHAPPVIYPVGRSRSVGLAAFMIGGAGLAAVSAWTWAKGAPGLHTLAPPAAVALIGWVFCQWARTPQGVLTWDGLAWRWSARDDAEGQLTVHLDLQHLLLLRWQVAGSAEWLWVERRMAHPLWPDLRRAVYSRANPDALPDADSSAANP